MENRTFERATPGWLPKFLALILATFWAVVPARARDVQMNRVSDTVIEITGGAGPGAWRLRYGTPSPGGLPEKSPPPLLVQVDKSRAYFSHGDWLRLIDTEKGVVIGRWHFSGQITRILPEGTQAQVAIRYALEPDQVFSSSITFDPEAPKIPYWPTNRLFALHLPQVEATPTLLSVARAGYILPDQSNAKMPLEQARTFIPPLEEAVRRDPCSPWFRIYLGKSLRDAGDSGAREVLEAAIHVPTTDFTELLRISAYLDRAGEHDLAREAFERGYQDFLARGNDPRLVTSLIARLVIYGTPLQFAENTQPDSQERKELIERAYLFSPNSEGAGFAWQLYADFLKSHGQRDEARLWERRANESRRFLLGLGLPGSRVADGGLLVVVGSALAVFFYVLVLYFRYRPQRRFDLARRRQALEPSTGSAISGFRSPSLGRQITIVALVTILWLIAYPSRGNALLAFYYVFPITVFGFLVIYLLRWRKARRAMTGSQSTVEAATYSWLDFRRWGKAKRIGFFAAIVAGLIFAYMVPTPFGAPSGAPLASVIPLLWSPIAAASIYLLIIYALDWPRRRREERAAQLPPGFSWANMIYWSPRERVGFLLIGVVGWIAIGMTGQYVQTILRLASTPICMSMGSFAGPATSWYLENRLPPTPERDLLLAISYQQSGEKEKAERLYRTLPNFAESWNNLGVLWKQAGKDEEARRAFERALQLDPGLAEAALNLGRPAQSFWTEQHQKYLPGRPMLAPPQRERWLPAYAGGSLARLWWRALGGPFFGGFSGLKDFSGMI